MVDLVTEFTEGAEEGKRLGPKILMVSTSSPLAWEVYTDSAANQKGSGIWIFLVAPEKITVEKSLRLGFPATNNVAKYKALLAGMAMVSKLGAKAVEVLSDSRLEVGKISGEFEAKDQ